MKTKTNYLGKVAVTVEKDYYDSTKDYDKLVIVEVENEFKTYISRKPVPAGTKLTDREYWIPFSSFEKSSIAKLSYKHRQNTPSKTWSINHDLGYYPSVTVQDSSGNNCIGEIKYIDANNLIIEFSSEMGGIAYLS